MAEPEFIHDEKIVASYAVPVEVTAGLGAAGSDDPLLGVITFRCALGDTGDSYPFTIAVDPDMLDSLCRLLWTLRRAMRRRP